MASILNKGGEISASAAPGVRWVNKNTFLELEGIECGIAAQARVRRSSAPPSLCRPPMAKTSASDNKRLQRLNRLWHWHSSPGQFEDQSQDLAIAPESAAPQDRVPNVAKEVVAGVAEVDQASLGGVCSFPASSSYYRKRFRPCKGKRLRMQKYIQRQANDLVDSGSAADGIWSEHFEVPESVLRNPITWQLFQKMVNGKVKELRREMEFDAEPDRSFMQQACWGSESSLCTESTWIGTPSATSGSPALTPPSTPPMTPPTYEYMASPMAFQRPPQMSAPWGYHPQQQRMVLVPAI